MRTIPESSKKTRLPGRRSHEVYDADAANRDREDKLRRNSLRRRARVRGYELRQSAYGYALIDGSRERVDGRNDLTLDEVAARLAK
jgi:hypothetical protein